MGSAGPFNSGPYDFSSYRGSYGYGEPPVGARTTAQHSDRPHSYGSPVIRGSGSMGPRPTTASPQRSPRDEQHRNFQLPPTRATPRYSSPGLGTRPGSGPRSPTASPNRSPRDEQHRNYQLPPAHVTPRHSSPRPGDRPGPGPRSATASPNRSLGDEQRRNSRPSPVRATPRYSSPGSGNRPGSRSLSPQFVPNPQAIPFVPLMQNPLFLPGQNPALSPDHTFGGLSKRLSGLLAFSDSVSLKGGLTTQQAAELRVFMKVSVLSSLHHCSNPNASLDWVWIVCRRQPQVSYPATGNDISAYTQDRCISSPI